jgi:hypothetical protein
MMPVSFTGFGATALLGMLFILVIAQAVKHLRNHKTH